MEAHSVCCSPSLVVTELCVLWGMQLMTRFEVGRRVDFHRFAVCASLGERLVCGSCSVRSRRASSMDLQHVAREVSPSFQFDPFYCAELHNNPSFEGWQACIGPPYDTPRRDYAEIVVVHTCSVLNRSPWVGVASAWQAFDGLCMSNG